MPKAVPFKASSLIEGYNLKHRDVIAYPKFYDVKTNKFTPMGEATWQETSQVLDCITLAVEAGVIKQTGWVKQIFGNKAAFESFAEVLAGYDELFRITDRWWQALAALAEVGDEEGFITCQDIVDVLTEYAEESGQL